MPQHDDAEPARRHRRRNSDVHRKHHQGRRSRDHSFQRDSDWSSRESGQHLSIGALAQLDAYNANGYASEPARETQRKPKREKRRREEYRVVDAEDAPEDDALDDAELDVGPAEEDEDAGDGVCVDTPLELEAWTQP